MTIAQLNSVLGITSRFQRKRVEKLCLNAANDQKVAILFHIDNVYVDAIFQLDNINSATIEGIKRDFMIWVDGLEQQVKRRKLTICGLSIAVVSDKKFSYFLYDGKAELAMLPEANMNRFERILLQYLKQGASVIFNRWVVLDSVNGRVVVQNTPMGIYRVTEMLRPADKPPVNARLGSSALEQKGNFATKIFSSGIKGINRQPEPNKVVSLNRRSNAGARTATVVLPKEDSK